MTLAGHKSTKIKAKISNRLTIGLMMIVYNYKIKNIYILLIYDDFLT